MNYNASELALVQSVLEISEAVDAENPDYKTPEPALRAHLAVLSPAELVNWSSHPQATHYEISEASRQTLRGTVEKLRAGDYELAGKFTAAGVAINHLLWSAELSET